MKPLTLVVAHILSVLLIGVTSAWAGAVTLAWDPNPEPNIAGYVVAYGTTLGNYPSTVNVGNRTTWQLPGLTNGQRYYFVVRAYDTNGLMSPDSAEVDTHILDITVTSNVSPRPTVGQPISWVASSSVPTEYRFWRLSAGTWRIVQDYSSQNTYTWTPTAADTGSHQVQVWARVVGSARDYNTWQTSGVFTVESGFVVIGTLESSVALPASTGTPITWRARTIGTPAPLQYKFWRYNHVSGWIMVQDYSVNNTYTWTPGPGDEGMHSLQVWVRPNGSVADYVQWRGIDFEVLDMTPAIGSIVTNTAFPAGTGTRISWRVNASGGPNLQYKFWRRSAATGVWTAVQNYSSSNTFTWTPGVNDEGAYSLQVWVRRAGSIDSHEAWKGHDFTIANSVPTITSLKADTGQPIGSGTAVTWRAETVGGPGPFEYKFWLYNTSTGSWTPLAEYGTRDSVTWTPRSADAGSYLIQAWVRRQGSMAPNPAAYLSTEPFTVRDAVPSLAAITRDVDAITAGMPVTWTAVAGGGPGPLEYQFWRYDESLQTWSIAQAYSWDNTLSWVPKPSERGSHTIQVWVRRFGITDSYESWLSVPVTVD